MFTDAHRLIIPHSEPACRDPPNTDLAQSRWPLLRPHTKLGQLGRRAAFSMHLPFGAVHMVVRPHKIYNRNRMGHS